MSDTPKTNSATLVKAMRILSQDIQSDDGVANAAIAEAADRIEHLERELSAANHQITLLIAGSKKDERQLRRLKDALQEAYEEGYADCSFGEDCNYQASRAKRIADGKE